MPEWRPARTARLKEDEMNIQMIALDRLRPSERNVRKSFDANAISGLAANIHAHGLLHSLVVAPDGADTYAIVDGRRRYEALSLLRRHGEIPEDYKVPCTVVAPEGAEAQSLAANVMREEMGPADEFEAFARLVKAGATVEDLGRQFGRTTRYIEQRLALAALSPKLLAELKAGRITLAQAEAYTLLTLHSQQEKLFKQIGPKAAAHWIRQQILGDGFDGEYAIFSEADYVAAGGKIIRDLFDPRGRVTYSDTKLAAKLQREAVDRMIEALKAEGWRNVTLFTDAHSFWLARQMCDEIEPPQVKPDKETAARIKALEKELSELEEKDELDDGEHDRMEEIDEELARLWHGEFGPEDKAQLDVFVFLDSMGRVQVVKGLKQREKNRQAEIDDLAGRGKEKKKPEEKGYSGPVREHVAAVRARLLQSHMLSDLDLCLRVLLVELGSAGGAIRATPHWSGRAGFHKGIPLDDRMQKFAADVGAESETWELEPLSWAEVEKMPLDQVKQRIAWIVAMASGPNQYGNHVLGEHLQAIEAAYDPAQRWRPDQAFLERLSKAQILAAFKECGVSASSLAHYERLSKGALVTKAVGLFSKPENHSQTGKVAEALRTWLPEGLRREKPKAKAKKRAA
jgi:ParB family chromosome partitioning protein